MSPDCHDCPGSANCFYFSLEGPRLAARYALFDPHSPTVALMLYTVTTTSLPFKTSRARGVDGFGFFGLCWWNNFRPNHRMLSSIPTVPSLSALLLCAYGGNRGGHFAFLPSPSPPTTHRSKCVIADGSGFQNIIHSLRAIQDGGGGNQNTR